ncbi:MAG: PfkB family carbohydrate kinase [Actinomycetota bacterium]|nr:PfkB family carbohydrate kinase [Actinomycetota bacterium]
MSSDGRSPLVTVIGEALIDLVPAGSDRTFVAHPGGSPFNVAVGLARLGTRTALMARLGDCAFGAILRRQARDEGIDLSAAPLAREATSLAVVSFDAEARASYDFYFDGTADWNWSAPEVDRVPAGTTVLHFGSVASWRAPGDVQITRMVEAVRQGGEALVSYDPNIRPLLLRDPAHGRAMVERSVGLAHVVKASSEDVGWLYPGHTLDTVGRRWLNLGVRLVVFTDGASGAVAVAASGATAVRPGLAVDLSDTVGAGDSFTSALIDSLVRLGVASPTSLDTIAESDLAAVVEDAVVASALTCERPGADPPTAVEVATARRRFRVSR